MGRNAWEASAKTNHAIQRTKNVPDAGWELI